MALSPSERAEVRMWLGYAERLRGSAGYAVPFAELERAMDALSAEAEALVRQQLVRLRALDDSIYGDGSAASAGSVQQAGIKQLGQGEIEWFSAEGAWLSQEAAQERLIERLAALLGVMRLQHTGLACPIPLS